MKILYSDDLYPSEKVRGSVKSGRSAQFIGKTIGEILSTHKNPRAFVRSFNALNNNYAISDEVMVDRKHGYGYFHGR